jgi:iron complex outermembrane receptor protein
MNAFIRAALSCAIACALPAMALAEEATKTLDEVVVTAPPMEEPLTVVTDPKAPRQPVPAHDGADYLKSIPGFNVIRKGGTDGDPVLRGLAGSRLNVLLDGANVLGGCGMRMDPPTAYVFPESYDRITVLKGPQTVLYGGGNVAGTALFERETLRFEEAGARGFAGALAGSFGRYDLVADATGGTRTGFVRAIGTYSTADNYEDGDGNEVHSEYTRWSGSLIGGWTPNDNTRIEISTDRSDGEAAYADRSMDGTMFDRTAYGALLIKERLSPLFEKLEAQVYHNYVDHVMDNYSLRTKTAAMFMVNNPDRTTDGARLSARLAASDATALTLGLDYQQNEHTLRQVSSATVPDIEALARTPDMTFENTGVFAEATHRLDDRNRLIGGLRYDALDVTNEKTTGVGALSSTSDRMTGAFVRHERDHDSGITTFVGLGHAERPADWWERSTYGGFFLEPEKNTQLDVGLIHAGEKWRAALSLFYADIDDFILTHINNPAQPCTVAGNCTAANVDATTWGAEAEVGYALSARWKTYATAAWVRGDNDTQDVPLAQIPPLEGRLGLEYDDKTWSFGVLMRAVDDQDRVHVGYGSIVGQDIGPTPGFTVFSVNGGWRANKQARITAGVDNLFDKTYAEHISRSGAAVAGFVQTTRVNEPGRNYWLKASVTF